VSALGAVDPGLVQPVATTGTGEAAPPPKINFQVTKEQAVAFVKTFNQFLDNIISLMVSLDIVYYSKMDKANITAMGNAIAVYIDHSGFQVTPGVFLLWNVALIYGSQTLQLPGIVRKERIKFEEKILAAQDAKTNK